MIRILFLAALVLVGLAACTPTPDYDLIIRGGTLYDGSGGAPVVGDLALRADTIAALGDLGAARGRQEIDATGLAVAPGFINMLSWATESLLIDGQSQSDIRQGVTLEVFGEGWSMGPLNDAMKEEQLRGWVADFDSAEAVAEMLGVPYGDGQDLAMPWTTLG